ncbi:MAG: rhodanese-like domain-containing protein [Elusimicrobia bacterium]|nr:rhodanese-like domain-containing protein [Elusimicrobiota bacterium]
MTTTAMKYRLIDAKALKDKLDNKETFQLWNVLTKEYYKAEANIPGSQWLPVDSLTETLINEKAPTKDALIVTYCGGLKCPSSKQAADKLVSLGYTNVFAFEGGLQEWTEAGFPVVTL